jgi:hypothetical protein
MAFKSSTHWRKVVSCTVTKTEGSQLPPPFPFNTFKAAQAISGEIPDVTHAPGCPHYTTLMSAEEGGGDGMLELKAGTPSHPQRASCIRNTCRQSRLQSHKFLATDFLSFALCSTPRSAAPTLEKVKVSDKTRLTITDHHNDVFGER